MDNYDAIHILRAMLKHPDFSTLRSLDREAIALALAALEEKEESRFKHTER